MAIKHPSVVTESMFQHLPALGVLNWEIKPARKLPTASSPEHCLVIQVHVAGTRSQSQVEAYPAGTIARLPGATDPASKKQAGKADGLPVEPALQCERTKTLPLDS